MKKRNGLPASEKHEEALKQLFQHIDIEPTDELKEKSFQKALAGMELARNIKRRKKAASKLQLVFSFAAAAAGILLMMYSFFQTDGQPESFQHSEQQNNYIMSLQESQYEEKNGKAKDRPETIELTISLEGMEEKETYHLVNMDPLPFTTYIPDRWQAEFIKEKNLVGARLVAVNEKYGKVDVMFFPNGTSFAEAEKYIIDQLLSDQSYEDLSKEKEEGRNMSDWSLRSFVYQNAQQTRTGEIYLSEHNGQYFYIQSEFENEALEGWGSRTKTILEQWEWKDTRKRLGDDKD